MKVITDTIAERDAKPFIQPRKLTRKQQAFVDGIINNPKLSATEIAERVYNTFNRRTANAIAGENLAKPSIIMALNSANKVVEETLIDVVTDWGHSDNTRQREIALNNAQYIHDKIHGKAKQSMDVNSASISLTIDLTSALSGENGVQ